MGVPSRNRGRLRCVNDTRAMYVENDPALRAFMSHALEQSDGIELLMSCGTPSEALAFDRVQEADVALLDLALGVDELNGIDLGIALRERHQGIGIVIYSQHSLRNLARRVPDSMSEGWSFIAKSGDMNVADIVSVLRETARGVASGHFEAEPSSAEEASLELLSPRQRAVMALAATGLSAPEIAIRLGASQDSIRKDLSRSYKVLVPHGEGGDLRTRAVLVYLRLVRDSEWDDVT